MLPLAATAAESVRATPVMVWIKFGALILGVILVILLLRKLMQINRFLILVVVVVGGSILLINWTYNRTEPRFLTPIIDQIAPYLPGGKGLDAPTIDPNNPEKTKRK